MRWTYAVGQAMAAESLSRSQILHRAHGCSAPGPAFGMETLDAGGACMLCGAVIRQGVPRKKVLSSNFMNMDILTYPQGTHFCAACVFALKEPTFRRTSFICSTSEFRPLKRDMLAEALFHALPEDPYLYLFCVTTSYKKHLWLHAPVNLPGPHVQVQFDDMTVDVHLNTARAVLDAIEALYTTFTKEEIRSGHYRLYRLERFGAEEFERHERLLRPHRGSPVFGLLVYIANRKEKVQCKEQSAEPRPNQMNPPQRNANNLHETQLLLF